MEDWHPEGEVDEEQKEEAKQLMRRDEAMTIIMSLVEAQTVQATGLEPVVDAAIEQTQKILKFLDDTAPF